MSSLFKMSPRFFHHLPFIAAIVAVLMMLLLVATVFPLFARSESALQIRTLRQGSTLPDGFYVYQTLSAQGIRIKSITPDRDSLVIKFESQEQIAAAERVLRDTIPIGFDIARQEGHSIASWISRAPLRT